jgi:outer membrane usher protein
MVGRFQYRNEKGIYTANYTYSAEGVDKGGLSYAGSLALINGSLHVGRPIHDSFALVQATGLDNVEVLSNSVQVGATNDDGKLLVSELTSYQENRLSIQTKNMPLNYNLAQREQYVQVGQRSGSLVTFEIIKFTAVEGNLHSPDGKALELFPLEIIIKGEKQESFSGNDGYFYLEKIPVGEHDLRVRRSEGDCIVKLKVPKPEPDKIVVSLGELTCVQDK